MKHLKFVALFLALVVTGFGPLEVQAARPASAAPTSSETYTAAESGSTESEFWREPLPNTEWSLSFVTGLGLLHPGTGWQFGFLGSRRLMRTTPLEEFSNDLHAEVQIGPTLFFGSSLGLQVPVVWGAHARWDFHFNRDWTFYALGGFGMSWANLGGINLWNFYPRFGVGAFFKLSSFFAVRGEISHEQTVVGGSFFF